MYYTEYCLLQYSQGKTKISINALKTLILSRPPVLTLKSKEEKEALIAVYRTYCEVLIGANQRREALNLLINLGNNAIIDAAVSIHSLVSAEKKFKQVATELLEELESEVECSMEDLLMPNFIIEWVSCYFWLIALTKTSVSLKNFSEDFFHLLDNKTGLIIEQIRQDSF